MRVDDARWAVEAFHQPADPHLEFAVKFSEEGGGEDTAQLAPPLAFINWAGCAWFTVLFHIFIRVRCGWCLIKPTNGAPKPKVHDVRVSLLAFSAEGLETLCLHKPLRTDACCYCMLYLAR